MPTFLVFHDDGADLKVQRVTWSAPKRIQEFWFGDSPENSRIAADVFPDTEAARVEMETVIAAYQAAMRAKDLAFKARLEACNKKARGELGE